MAYRFDGKRALVTGGSRGIGRCIVKALIDAGAKEVYAIGKTKENLDKLKSEYPQVNVIAVDLANWEATRSAVENIGKIDLLVNNAANVTRENILPMTPFVDKTKDQLDLAIAVNLKAAFNISQVVAKGMIKQSNGGAIVNISSTAGLQPIAGVSDYCISKAAMDMMTKCMALELGPHKIRVNTVSPTGVHTESLDAALNKFQNDSKVMERFNAIVKRHPLGKLTEMEDIKNATMFLLSDQSSMITGTILPVDCGFMVS